MNVRALAAKTSAAAIATAALTLALAACTTNPGPSASPTASDALTAGPTTAATNEPTTPAAPTGDVTIREIVAGAVLESTANALRTQFPSWAQFDDTQIEQILNAGCDALDSEANPIAAADAIAAYGLEAPEAAFGLYAAISNYCPEYSQFVTG